MRIVTLAAFWPPTWLQAVTIQFDYSYDTANFFADPQRRAALETAARIVDRFGDSLAAINPQPTLSNTYTASFPHPGTGQPVHLENLPVPADTLIVFVGARNLGGNILGQGGPGSYNVSGTQQFVDRVSNRAQGTILNGQVDDYGVWGGTLTFNTNFAWSFSLTEVNPSQIDFITVASHELGHILGFGTAASWTHQVDFGNARFTGANSASEYGSPVPLTPDYGHWGSNVVSSAAGGAQAPLMGPGIVSGRRSLVTSLDVAGLRDIGWEVAEPGDADRDGDTDTADLNRLLENWTGAAEPWTQGRRFFEGDFDEDADVDTADLNLLLASWTGAQAEGATSPRFAADVRVPEPAAAWLCLQAAAMMAGVSRWRKRDGTPSQSI